MQKHWTTNGCEKNPDEDNKQFNSELVEKIGELSLPAQELQEMYKAKVSEAKASFNDIFRKLQDPNSGKQDLQFSNNDLKSDSDLEISKANELYNNAKTSFKFSHYEGAYNTFSNAKKAFKNILSQTKIATGIEKKIEKINYYLKQCVENSQFDKAKLQYEDAKTEFKFENYQEAYRKFLGARTFFKDAKKTAGDNGAKISAKLEKINTYLDDYMSSGNNLKPK